MHWRNPRYRVASAIHGLVEPQSRDVGGANVVTVDAATIAPRVLASWVITTHDMAMSAAAVPCLRAAGREAPTHIAIPIRHQQANTYILAGKTHLS